MGKITPVKIFYNSIKDKSKYKLVNGLFIVRSIGGGKYKYVGDFHKKGSLYAKKLTSTVETYGISKQVFYPKPGLVKSDLGVWLKLRISFKMKPISDILK